MEEVATVGGVDIEKDSWNHDRFFFQELFEEGLFLSAFFCERKKREKEKHRSVSFLFVCLFVFREEGEMRRTRPLFKGGWRLSKFNQM